MVTRTMWARSLLLWGGFPVAKHNLWALVSWQMAEGCMAKWNPIAATKPMPGSTDFNVNGGFPVQNYQREEDGLSAVIQTLHAGAAQYRYQGIIDCLARDAWASTTLKAVEKSAWGTGGLALLCLPYAKRNWTRVAYLPIGQ